MNLKDAIINSYFTSFVWFKYKYLKNRLPMRIASVHPLNPKKVVFMSFNGKNYADNPRAISEKLYEMFPDYEIVWGMTDIKKAKKVIPSYVKVVKYGTYKWYREMATAGCWATSVLLPYGVLKRKGQRYIQVWHGDRGMKKILFDATESMDKFHKRNFFRKIIEPELCDLGMAGSDYGIMQYRSAMHYNGKILKQGTARCDRLINLTEEVREQMKRKLHIPKDRKVLLYAPTFRDHKHGDVQTSGELNILAILDFLDKKTGEKWIGIQRGHIGSRLEQKEEYRHKVRDMTSYEDMADILCVTDLLITDFSSTAGDFALLGKGIFLYLEDYEEYVSEDRQLYFDMKDTPFWMAHSQKEMLELIDSWTEEKAIINDEEILRFYNTFETGMAAEAAVKYIVGEMN